MQALISKGKTVAREVARARILLLVHAGEKDPAIRRHPIVAKMAEANLYAPNRAFSQTNAQDLIGCREFHDLDYVMIATNLGIYVATSHLYTY